MLEARRMLGIRRKSTFQKLVVLSIGCFIVVLLLLSKLTSPWGLESTPLAYAQPESTPLAYAQSYGELGKPVILPSNLTEVERKLVEDGWRKNGFNQYVSDLISVHRSLPDPRDPWCMAQNYSTDLPQTSVVVALYNEAWSVLLRTVHSIIDRSPSHLVKEIILVDDYSNMPHLKEKLEKYMAAYPKVKIVRTTKREGLIRARLLGANHATAPVLTYLDSHCECAEGWLEPLLDRIHKNEFILVSPATAPISDETMEVRFQDARNFFICGFTWNLLFAWKHLTLLEKQMHIHPAEPVQSPTMMGSMFAISSAFFQKLGAYDEGFELWGAENLELSFKTWMCGGTLEIVPCSHVAHIFRTRAPYKRLSKWKRNSVRLAKVWMDEYAQYYYQRIGNHLGDYGDIEPRIQLRKKLGCKSFKWYLETIYPELYIPDSTVYGEIRNERYRVCVDSVSELYHSIGIHECFNSVAGYQFWYLSKKGEIRKEDNRCLDYYGGEVVLYPCHGLAGNQLWSYNPDNKLVKHVVSNKCLTISTNYTTRVTIEECNSGHVEQRWKFGSPNGNVTVHYSDLDQELK